MTMSSTSLSPDTLSFNVLSALHKRNSGTELHTLNYDSKVWVDLDEEDQTSYFEVLRLGHTIEDIFMVMAGITNIEFWNGKDTSYER